MTENEVTQYRVYRIRWVQLLVYFLANFANGLPSGTFAPIESETATFFSITTTQVDALAIVFSFLYVVGTILSICLNRSVINTYGNDSRKYFKFGCYYSSFCFNFTIYWISSFDYWSNISSNFRTSIYEYNSIICCSLVCT